MGRAPCCEKMGLKKGPWTPEEDQILINYIRLHGHTNWRALPKLAGLLRCGKSCRLRWTNYLRPDIKRGNFTLEEEETIINLHQMLGNRWSAIAAKLPGRTDNEIKNVWHTHLKKRVPKSDSESVALIDEVTTMEPNKKRSRKLKATIKNSTSKKSKAEYMKRMELEDDNDNDNCNNKDDSNVSAKAQSPNANNPVSPQPCTSDMSTLTSTSTSTSENDNRSKENVGKKGEYFDDFTEIDEDFWMEVLSVEDTAMSTIENLSCANLYDQNTSSMDPAMDEPTLDSSFKQVHGDDMDFFWYNLLTRSNELP